MRIITPKHIEAYQKGCLKKLFDVVKEDPELSFEIRKDNEVMIYYRKGKVLTIKYTGEDIINSYGKFLQNFKIIRPNYSWIVRIGIIWHTHFLEFNAHLPNRLI